MICHDKKIIFIHIARTGGSSVEHALVGMDWWLIDSATKHLSAKQARELYGEEIWNSYFKFTIVRNPWDRLVSMYSRGSWTPVGVDNFEVFLREVRPHPNEKYDSLLYTKIINEKLDAVLRYETLYSDFYNLIRKLKIENINLIHLEKTKHSPYKDYYNYETIEYVKSKFYQDIVNYKYSF